MSIIKDTFFGGAEKKAAKAQQKGIEKGIDTTKESTAQAREALFKLFPAAQQNAQQGFQSAIDVFGKTIPQQAQAYQQGNIGAQNTLLAGMPQQQNALFGNQVDYSQFQPVQVQTDMGFAQQQLPEFVDPYAQQPQKAPVAQNQFTSSPNASRVLGGNSYFGGWGR